MNYNTGNGRIFPTIKGSRQSKFEPNAPLITFPPPSNGVSHPHMALEHRGEVLVPDLVSFPCPLSFLQPRHSPTLTGHHREVIPFGGSSRLLDQIPIKSRGLYHNPKAADHVILRFMVSERRSVSCIKCLINHVDDRLFTIHELSSTLSVQSIPAQPNGTSTTFAIESIIPSNSPAGAKWAAAEVLIPPPTRRFPIPYIYVSNRNVANNSPQGDSIAIFEHVNKGKRNEGLKLVKQVFTGLNQIRGMEFGNAQQGGEEFLAASGVAGTGGVIILRRVAGGRDLQIVARNTDVLTRSSFVWL